MQLKIVKKSRGESLFQNKPVQLSPQGDLIDALLAEVQFATGIEAALLGVEVIDTALMDGALELVRAHIDRLNAIGRLAEKAVLS